MPGSADCGVILDRLCQIATQIAAATGTNTNLQDVAKTDVQNANGSKAHRAARLEGRHHGH
jgi:hypothetical protein